MKRKNIFAYVLASSMYLTACGSTRYVIKENKVNSTNEYVSLYYRNQEEQTLDYQSTDYQSERKNVKTNKKVFDVGKHNLIIKIAATLGYDEFVQIEGPEFYELVCTSYVENATGSDGKKYGCIVFQYRNTVPVEAIGVLDEEKEIYVYTTPGTPVALEENQKLKLTK